MNTLPISVGNGGWVRVAPNEGVAPTATYIRFQARPNGRLEACEVYVQDDAGLSLEQALRVLPLDRLTVWANSAEGRQELLESLHDPAPDLATYIRFYRWNVHRHLDEDGGEVHWVAQSFDDQRRGVAGPKLPEDETGPRRQRRPSAKLKVPTGQRRFPEKFYQDVARAYTDLAWRTDKPSVEIAEANGVEATTVRGWVAGARRRGYLAKSPGRGKVG